MNPGWSRELLQFALLLAVALAGGWFWDHLLWWLLAALAVELAVQFFHLWRLDRWLRQTRSWHVPVSTGVWAEVCNQIYRMRRRERERKHRLVQLLREIRDSTAAMPDGVVIFNRVGEIRWLNENAGHLLGLRVPQDVGQRIANLVRQPEFLRYLDSRRYEEPLEMPAPFADDAHLSVHIVPYGGDQRLLIVRDVSRLRRLEQMRREFVANASHELRTPLTVLRGYLDMMVEDAELHARWRDQLQEMHRQTSRMTAIVNDLLELSRLETESREAPYAPVNVAALLARLQAEARGLGYGPRTVELEAEPDLLLLGAEEELYSAFSNLLVNAMKYTPPEGRVRLVWRRADDGACFGVTDTGIGIPPEHLPRLTERFYRVDRSRNRDSGGTGLGLAIVKHVLQHHGAALTISSQPGRGSTFRCLFPAERVRFALSPAARQAGP